MRREAEKIKSIPLTPESIADKKSLIPGVFRIIDQSGFDYDEEGGCQFATIFSAIENKYKTFISPEEMRDCYLKADKFWDGKTEKISRAVKYMMVKGYKFNFGKIKAVNYYSIAPTSIDFDLMADAIEKFDYAGIGFKRGPWFSEITGKLYEQLRLDGIHACRAISGLNDDEIAIVNSWFRTNGEPWGDKGMGHIPRKKFDILQFVELRFCDFIIEN